MAVYTYRALDPEGEIVQDKAGVVTRSNLNIRVC
jgi:hypothetical protein